MDIRAYISGDISGRGGDFHTSQSELPFLEVLLYQIQLVSLLDKAICFLIYVAEEREEQPNHLPGRFIVRGRNYKTSLGSK